MVKKQQLPYKSYIAVMATYLVSGMQLLVESCQIYLPKVDGSSVRILRGDQLGQHLLGYS